MKLNGTHGRLDLTLTAPRTVSIRLAGTMPDNGVAEGITSWSHLASSWFHGELDASNHLAILYSATLGDVAKELKSSPRVG